MKLRDAEFHYINLDCRPDRRAHAEAEFARHDIPVNRFSAYLPEQCSWAPEKIARMKARTIGAIGCMSSQMEIISKAPDDGVIGVFEDDVCLCEDFPKRLEYIFDHLPEDWDVIYLGATFHSPGVWCHKPDCETWGGIGRDVIPTADPRILRTPGIWSTYAYLVNGKKWGDVYSALMKIMPDCDGIDHAFIRIGMGLKTYCFVPGCCKQYDDWSNIRKGGFTRFSNFKALGPWWYANRMTDFDAENFDWNTFDPKRWDGEKGIYHEV